MNSEAPHEKHVIHLAEIDFTIAAETFSSHVEFTIFDVKPWSDGAPWWECAVPDYAGETTGHLDRAAAYLHGSVKWDGCSNWYFDGQGKNEYLHACNRKDLHRISAVMVRCWDWTAELCPNWDHDN